MPSPKGLINLRLSVCVCTDVVDRSEFLVQTLCTTINRLYQVGFSLLIILASIHN